MGFFFWVHINKSGFLWWEAFDGKVEWGGVVGLCMERGGDYARLTHVNLSSVCFLRDRARTRLSVPLLHLIAFERES